jgi:hypothetical protein
MILNKTLVYKKEGSADMWRSFFFDFERFGEAHPAMHTVRRIKPADGMYGGEFLVYETLMYKGVIPLRPTYTVHVNKEEDGSIRYYSKVKSYVDLTIDFRFSEENLTVEKQTIIEEVFAISAPPVIAPLFYDILKGIHLVLINGIELQPEPAKALASESE